MTTEEADALFLSGLPGPAAELGLGTVVAAARLKVLAALPTELRGRASRLLERFHLDAAGWFRAGEDVPHLAAIAQCVWDGQRLELDYARADTIVTRTLDPLGLVLKAGVWYLVAASRRPDPDLPGVAGPRRRAARRSTRAAPRASTSPPTGPTRSRPTSATSRASRSPCGCAATSTRWLEDVIDAPVLALAVEEPDPEPDAWRRIRVTLDWPREVAGRLLALGGAVEVLGPPELRAEIASLAAETVARYREPASAGVAGHGRLRGLRPVREPLELLARVPEARRDAGDARPAVAKLALAVCLDGLCDERHVEHGSPRPIDLSDTLNPIVRWCQFLS